MRRVALALAALAACSSDPDYPCFEGTYRDPGPACTSPALLPVLDGQPTEWTDPHLLITPECGACEPLPCRACTAGDVTAMSVARDGGDALVVYMATDGAPLELPMTYYGASFDPLTFQDGRSIDVLVRPGEVRVFQEGFELYGIDGAIAAAFGPAGVELRVAVDLLPFAYGAKVSAEVWEPRFGALTPRHEIASGFVFAQNIDACWDPAGVGSCQLTGDEDF